MLIHLSTSSHIFTLIYLKEKTSYNQLLFINFFHEKWVLFSRKKLFSGYYIYGVSSPCRDLLLIVHRQYILNSFFQNNYVGRHKSIHNFELVFAGCLSHLIDNLQLLQRSKLNVCLQLSVRKGEYYSEEKRVCSFSSRACSQIMLPTICAQSIYGHMGLQFQKDQI